MKRTMYDYRGLSLKTVREERFRHLRLFVFTWGCYFLLYFLTENLIPAENCYPTHCILDDKMPFNEFYVVFYVGWYLLVGGSLLFYGLYDVDSFVKLDLYIFVTQIIGMTCYILFPTRQDLRPEFFARENVFTWIMGIIYRFDTNTGVCPSLHVAYSLAILSVIWKDKRVHRVWKIVLLWFVVEVALATCYVKQHSMVDVFAAIPTALVGEYLIFHTGLCDRIMKKSKAYKNGEG